MDVAYPSRPDGVPADLIKPSRALQRRAWSAGAGLLAFATAYVLFTFWLGLTAYRLFALAFRPDGNGSAFLLALPPFFLMAFLIKGVFFVKKGDIGDAIEVKAQDEPGLFEFIHRVADDAGAPRPHRVFLTPEVNASVFYDLSAWNFVFPSKKNLNVGLGLVNVLTLDEFKAVLAHEFGHFAQRTMAVGTWVYVARQALGAVIARRDAFDRFLDGLSRFDIRIAWIGWVMRLIVWSIRALLDTGFRGVLLLQRALSREMEFQADLVSVSLCGSDSLIHGLRRLGPADDALGRALTFASEEARGGKPVADVFEVQLDILGQLRRVWRDPLLGSVPPRPELEPARHRVFTRDIAEVPRMWATHPPSHEREERAKSRYLPSSLDSRSAWVVFADGSETRRRMTAFLYREWMREHPNVTPAAMDETRARLVAGFERPAFDETWQGVYVGRSVVRDVSKAAHLLDELPADRAAIRSALDALYPAEIVATLSEWRDAENQLRQLEALAKGTLEAPGGVIRFQGRAIRRRELPRIVEEARADRDRLREALVSHDRRVRTAHAAAALAIGGGWDNALSGLRNLLHYFEHLRGDLDDANGALSDVFRIVTARGKVSSADAARVVGAANEVFRSLETIYRQARLGGLPASAAARVGKPSWKDALGEDLKLTQATRSALAGNWLQAASTWVVHALRCLDEAASATLDSLLEAEARVAAAFTNGSDPGPAPEAAVVPRAYPTSAPWQARERPTGLGWWERFQLAQGWVPGAARLGVAVALLAPALLAARGVSTATVSVYNGLSIPVVVAVGSSQSVEIPPSEFRTLTIGATKVLAIEARTLDGRSIERFEAVADTLWATYVYNIAGAGVLANFSVGYGVNRVPQPVILGTARWLRSTSNYTLEDPPQSIDSNGPVVKTRLAALDRMTPESCLAATPDVQRATLVTVHARWDAPTSARYASWAHVAAQLGVDILPVLQARPEWARGDVMLGRLAQDVGGPEICASHRAAAEARPDDGDAVYLALRCLAADASASPFGEAAKRFPDSPWIGWGVAWEQMRDGRWDEAAKTLERIGPKLPALVDEVAESRLRALRMSGATLDQLIGVLPPGPRHQEFAFLLSSEAGQKSGADVRIGSWIAVTAARARGDLVEAARRAALIQPQPSWQVWMNAASDGAARAQVLEALALPGDNGLDAYTVWVALALRAREGQDRSDTEAVALRMSARVLALVRPILSARSDTEVTRAVREASSGAWPPERGLVALMGVIRLGERAPDEWRTESRALLLPWERPYVSAGPIRVRG